MGPKIFGGHYSAYCRVLEQESRKDGRLSSQDWGNCTFLLPLKLYRVVIFRSDTVSGDAEVKARTIWVLSKVEERGNLLKMRSRRGEPTYWMAFHMDFEVTLDSGRNCNGQLSKSSENEKK